MDRGNVLSGAAFSAVLLSAMAFLVVLITLGFFSHAYVQRSMLEEMRQDMQARWNLLASDYRGPDGGIVPLTDLVASAALFTNHAERAVGVFAPDGMRMAGNIAKRPDSAGWQQAPLPILSDTVQVADTQSEYLYFSNTLGDTTLIVGQRMDHIAHTSRALFRALALTGGLVVLVMLGTGYIFSRKSLRKLEGLEATLAKVSDGDVAARVLVSANGDQIDRIALRMNTHLDTLSRLMVSTRTTAAAVAHDLKTPMARAYLGLGRALDRLDAGEDPRAEVEDTQAELERMNGIFDTFLRLARIESGGDAVQMVPLELDAILAELVETFALVAEDNGQTLSYHRAEGVAFEIRGDAMMIQQMVVNLLQNAVTHAGAGAQMSLHLDRAKDAVHLAVSDTGPGIPQAARAAVFEPFHRLDPSRNKPGSGLGLALVRAIVERHGARVVLSDNAPGLRVLVVFTALDAP